MGLTVTKKAAAPPPEAPKTTSAKTPAKIKAGIGKKSDVSTKADELKAAAAGKEQAPAEAQASVPAADTQTKALASTSTKTSSKGGASEEDVSVETVDVPSFVGAASSGSGLAEVGTECSFTHNKGNYESIKVGVSLKLPCEPGQINEAYDYATAWCSQRLNQALVEIGAQPAAEE